MPTVVLRPSLNPRLEGLGMRPLLHYSVYQISVTSYLFPSQANILILAFVKDGQFITTGEKVILPIFLVFSLFTSLLGAIAVRGQFMSDIVGRARSTF